MTAAVQTKHRFRGLLVPVLLVAVAAAALWWFSDRRPDVGVGSPGPEGIMTVCWTPIERAECLVRAEAALVVYRASGPQERIVEVHVGDDGQDMVCYGPSDQSYACQVTRDEHQG